MSETVAVQEARERLLEICSDLRANVRKLGRVSRDLRSVRSEPVGHTSAGTALTPEDFTAGIIEDLTPQLRQLEAELRDEAEQDHRANVVAFLEEDARDAVRWPC